MLENLKRRYKEHRLRKLLLENSEHDSFVQYSKSLTIKDVVYLGAKSWVEISNISLSYAWNKLVSGPDCNSQQEELLGLRSVAN